MLVHTVSLLCVITYSAMENICMFLHWTPAHTLYLTLSLSDIHLCTLSPGRWLGVNPSAVWVWSLPLHRTHDPSTYARILHTHSHTRLLLFPLPAIFISLLSHKLQTHLSFLPSKSSHFHSVPLSSLLQSIHLPLFFSVSLPWSELKITAEIAI